MDMFGTFSFSDAKLPLLDRVTELCTLLAIGELDFIPLDAVCDTLLEGITNRKDDLVDGDVLVIATRGLAHVLSHVILFNYPVSKKMVAVLVKCVDRLFQVVLSYYMLDTKQRNAVIAYATCHHGELNEEVLKIIKEVATCGTSPRLAPLIKAIPESFDRVMFCEHLLDGTKWTACYVIRFLNFLVRVGSGTDSSSPSPRRDRFMAITLAQLQLLASDFDMDYEWDELLRALTEMVVALSTFEKPSAADAAALTERYLQLVCKACVEGVAETRQELVLACADAVCALFSSKDKAPPVQHVGAETLHLVLSIIARIVGRDEHLPLHFPNPFLPSASSSNHGEEAAAGEGDGAVRVLSNVQWEVSHLQWSALALLGKLLGAVPLAKGQYEWAFRETDDMYYCYSAKDAAALTHAYFSRAPSVELKDEEEEVHHVNLRLMTDTNSRSKIRSQMFFQPIPTKYFFENKLMHVPSAVLAEKQVAACTLKTDLRRILRSVSFGSTPVASLAKMVFLHLVCHDTPQNTEETKGALRNLVSSQSPAVLEHLCTTLVKRDRTWAIILHEAGIGDALQGHWQHAPLESLPHAAGSRKRRRSSEKGESGPTRRFSPIAESIQKAGSAPPTPALLPQSTSDVELFLKTASFAELFRLLEDLTTVDHATCERIVGTVCTLAEGSEAHRTWCSALSAYLLRELQKLSISGSALHLLDTVQADRSFRAVYICPREEEAAGADRDAAASTVPLQLFCKKKHLLKVHFSTNWKCDLCGGSSEYGSLACRACDYDVCSHCTERALGCVRSNVSATVGDVLEAWRESSDASAKKRKRKKAVLDGLDLFMDSVLFSHSTPVSAVLHRKGALHCAAIGAPCKCGLRRPHALSGWAQQPKRTPIFRLLCHFAPFLCQENAVWRGIIEAVTSYGVLVFTHGVLGLPSPLYSAIACLRGSLPLAFKCELTRFLAVECRRYALKCIADAGVTLRGSAQGEVHMSGRSGKIVVPRDNSKDALLRLADAFHPSLSLRVKVTFAFEGEEGTGNGPTQELYAEMSSFFVQQAAMWYTTDDDRTLGLPSRTENKETEFFVCGALTGRAFVDGYAMDVRYDPLLWLLLRSEDRDRAATSEEELFTSSLWTLLAELEPAMANSFKQMLTVSASELDMMGVEDDQGNPITADNVLRFVAGKVQAHFATTMTNVQAFALGLLRSVDLSTLFALSDEELCLVFGGPSRDEETGLLFTQEQLESVVTEAHGYTANAKEVKMFTSIVGGEFTRAEQELFLEFLTGSRRLPLNGLQGLGRKITVVKKEMDSQNEATLPSCSTCFLYLKLPPYTSRDVMKKRLLLAITEGRKNFSLS